ncbi:MAG: MFS transporter [Steroidobacteraceae bacterium]
MAAVSIGITMSVLDGAIANIALPRIARDLGATPSAAVWVVNGFQLAVTVCLLPFAALGERFSARRVFQWGLLLFTAASFACGSAQTLTQLISGRIAQGVGAAGMMSTYPALLSVIYPRRLLGRGIGVSAAVIGVSGAIGPSVAAAILAVARWPWLFMLNVPLGVAGFALCARALPFRTGKPWPLDWLGSAGSAVVLALLVVGLDSLGRTASRPNGALQIVLAMALGAALLRFQARKSFPVVPVDLLRIPTLRLALGTSVCSYAAYILCFLSLPFLMQDLLGWSAVRTGLLLTPIPLAIAATAPLAGRLSDRHSAGLLCGIGLLLMTAGAVLLRCLPFAASGADLAWRGALFGIGFGFFQTPNNRALLHAAPADRASSVGGLLATARTTGQSCGAALLAVTLQMGSTAGVRHALELSACLACVGALVSILRLLPMDRPCA